MNRCYRFLVLAAAAYILATAGIRLNAQSYVSEVQANGFTLKKVASDTAIATGQNFSYTIYFSIPAGATNITITDVLPPSLAFQAINVTSACGSPIVSTPAVNAMGGTVSLTWASLPAGCSGSFVITVNFPNGITCNGTTARNRACLTGDIGTQKTDICTGFISTRAIASDPWAIGKWVIGAGTQAGPCNYVTADSIVKYQICVWKAVGVTGQLNLDNAVVRDTLPPGAILVNSSCGATQTGNVITWNLGSLSALPMYNTACCTFDVLYPTALFPTGTQIQNRATLTGTLGSANTPCGPAVHRSNTTCVEIKQYYNAFFSKYVYTNGQPGCSGKYQIWICNNGSVPFASLTITDTIPAPLTGITLGTVSSGLNASLSGNVVTVTLSSPLLPTQCRYFEVDFTIPLTATVGSPITNCAWLSTAGLPPLQACATFTVNAPAPKPCVWKEVCSKQPNYTPGSIFRYRLRVQNIGGLPITGSTITDNLDPNLQYIGNASFYTSSSWAAPCQSTSNWGPVGFSQTGNALTFTLPNIPATCQNIFYNACGMYGTPGVPYYFIEFDVKVADTAALGNIPNMFSIGGGNLTGSVPSNTDYVTVVGTSGFLLDKGVAADTTSWASSMTTTAGSNVNYRLRMTVAPGSVGLRHITFADLLPRDNGANDQLILGPCSPRGSSLDVPWVAPLSTLPVATDYNNGLSFATVNNFAPPGAPGPMFTGACGTLGTWSPGISFGAKNLGYYFGPTPVPAGNSATAMFTVQVPNSAQTQDVACNTFAANAAVRHLINSAIISDQQMGSLESQKACLSVVKDTGSSTNCFRVTPKSIVSGGVNPATGLCQYTIDLTVTNPNGSAILGWFESDQGTVSPSPLSLPSGTSTQTITFTDTPPANTFICIRFGIFINGQKQLCDSVCFDLPPCGQGSDCDSLDIKTKSVISNGIDPLTGLCTYTIDLTVTNSALSPLQLWFASNQGLVAPPMINMPTGTTTQTITFTDTLPQNTFICIAYSIMSANGLRDTCDSICIDLPPCDGESTCDSISIKQKSIVSAGIDPASGNCKYTVSLSFTNASPNPVQMWFESFQGSVSPSSLTLLTGSSTQTLTFIDTPPTDIFICIRYGILVNGQRILCDSVCFDLPPCDQAGPCDSLDFAPKSITSNGINPTNGYCTYTIALTATNSSASPVQAWFESYQGSVTPGTLTIPTGTSTQTLTFTDIPPVNTFICIRYGVIVNQNRILCDSICFDLPPCGQTGCDSLIDGKVDACCDYNVTIVNVSGSPVTSISYYVTGGTVNSINTSPCTPVAPAPFGSTSGVLTYSPSCPGNIGVNFSGTPNTPSNTITVTLVVHHANRDSCTVRFQYTCDPTPLVKCDEVKMKPFLFHGVNASGRTYTVFNTKIPSSPITSINIYAVPVPCLMIGGGLKVDMVSTSWSAPYSRIPITGSISALSSVMFNLGIDYSCNWSGNITLVIHHADGDSCVYKDVPWKAIPPILGGGVVTTDHIDKRVYANNLRLKNTFSNRAVKWVSIEVEDDLDEMMAGSGAHWNGSDYKVGYAILADHQQGKTEALFGFETPIQPNLTSDYFTVVVARDSLRPGSPVIRWTSYDEDGNAIATDTVSITSTILSARSGGESIAPNGFELLHFFPNPATHSATINYALGKNSAVTLELFNQTGEFVQTIDEGRKPQGMQSVRLNTFNLPPGTYYYTLTVDGVSATRKFQVVK